MKRILAALMLLPLPLMAQQQEEVTSASGAVLRGLDKISGAVKDLEIPSGKSASFGRIEVSVEDCRYPTGNPAGDAFAHVTIHRAPSGEQTFSGWMVASSPALNALDDPRYDVWVLRCITS